MLVFDNKLRIDLALLADELVKIWRDGGDWVCAANGMKDAITLTETKVIGLQYRYNVLLEREARIRAFADRIRASTSDDELRRNCDNLCNFLDGEGHQTVLPLK